MIRFYPNDLPSFENEPTKDRFEIKNIDKNIGEGVYSLVNFTKNDLVFKFSGYHTDEITQFSLQIEKDLYIDDPFFMGKILHSCNPNCSVDMENLTFTAIRDIKKNELITMDYDQTEDKLFKPFFCECGFENCKKIIKGRMVESEADKAERLLKNNPYHFAKTLSHIPHCYTRRREWASDRDFTWICKYISKHGIEDTFSQTGNYVYTYLYIGKYKYWVMEKNVSDEKQILINRAETKYT